MLYSVMSTKFRRAFRRILSCRSKGWQESRTEITFAAPSVANVIQNKGGSSKIEMMEKPRINTHQSTSYTENGLLSVCGRQKENVKTFENVSIQENEETVDKSHVVHSDRSC